jgi:hypothetical protein
MSASEEVDREAVAAAVVAEASQWLSRRPQRRLPRQWR